MTELWWWQASDFTPDWCQARRHWLRDPSDHAEGVLSQLVRRALLARRLGCAPESLRFVVGDKGKPALASSTLQFSVTHSHGWHLCLLSDLPCGVDVEPWDRKLDRLLRPDVLKRFAEREALADAAAFLRCWVMKEAWAKCLGVSVWQQLGEALMPDADGWRVPGMSSGYAKLPACVGWTLAGEASPPVLKHCTPELFTSA